jgi:hypothetical protein
LFRHTVLMYGIRTMKSLLLMYGNSKIIFLKLHIILNICNCIENRWKDLYTVFNTGLRVQGSVKGDWHFFIPYSFTVFKYLFMLICVCLQS